MLWGTVSASAEITQYWFPAYIVENKISPYMKYWKKTCLWNYTAECRGPQRSFPLLQYCQNKHHVGTFQNSFRHMCYFLQSSYIRSELQTRGVPGLVPATSLTSSLYSPLSFLAQWETGEYRTRSSGRKSAIKLSL